MHRITLDDAAQCFDLVNECAELWDDPVAWQDHLTAGIERLAGGCAGTFAVSRGSESGLEVLEAHVAPTDQALRDRFVDYMREGAFAMLPELALIAPRILRDGALVYAQSDLLDRQAYHRSAFYQRYMRAFGIEDALSAVEVQPGGLAIGLSIMRQCGEPRFSGRDHAVAELVARGVAQRVGSLLATRAHVTRSTLSPRLRATLDLLLEGVSEKEAALRLGVKPATAHEYVTALYRHYGVSSRSRLMALFIRRRPIIGSA